MIIKTFILCILAKKNKKRNYCTAPESKYHPDRFSAHFDHDEIPPSVPGWKNIFLMNVNSRRETQSQKIS